MSLEFKEITYLDPVESPAKQAFVPMLMAAVKEATGREAVVLGEHGSTGASMFAKNTGLHTVACGPGKPEQAHTKDEWIDVKDVENGVKFFEALAKKYLG
jgi:acetylornithine deacetylase